MEDPDQVFEDVMRYSRKQPVDFPDTFTSRSDLIRYLEQANPQLQTPKGINSLRHMVDSDAAKTFIVTRQERTALDELRKRRPNISRLKGKGIITEILRTNRARLRDESRTTNLLKTTNLNFVRWKKNPERFDFKGLDTETHQTIKDYVKQKIITEQRKGRKVYNDRDVYVISIGRGKRGNVYALNVLTGRFAAKRMYSRFGKLKDLVRER